MVITSKKNQLIKEDYKKILKGAAIACAGALATFALEVVPGIDFGQWTPIVVALNSVIANMVLKFVQINQYK